MNKTRIYKIALERIAEVCSVTYENAEEGERALFNSGYVSGTAELALRLANLSDGEKKEDE